MFSRKKNTASVATLAIAALALAACGDDNNQSVAIEDSPRVSSPASDGDSTTRETPQKPDYAITAPQDPSTWTEIEGTAAPETLAMNDDPELAMLGRTGQTITYPQTFITVNTVVDPETSLEMAGWRNGHGYRALGELTDVTDIRLDMKDSDFIKQPWAERVQDLAVNEYVLIDYDFISQYISDEEALAFAESRSPHGESLDPARLGDSVQWRPDYRGSRQAFGRGKSNMVPGWPDYVIPASERTIPPTYAFRYWLMVVPDNE